MTDTPQRRDKYTVTIDITMYDEMGDEVATMNFGNDCEMEYAATITEPHDDHAFSLKRTLKNAHANWLSADNATLNAECMALLANSVQKRGLGVAAERNDPRTEALAAAALADDPLAEGKVRKWNDGSGVFTLARAAPQKRNFVVVYPDGSEGQASRSRLLSHSTPVDEPSTPTIPKRTVGERATALLKESFDIFAYQAPEFMYAFAKDMDIAKRIGSFLDEHGNEIAQAGEPSTDDTDLATAVQAQANVEIGELKEKLAACTKHNAELQKENHELIATSGSELVKRISAERDEARLARDNESMAHTAAAHLAAERAGVNDSLKARIAELEEVLAYFADEEAYTEETGDREAGIDGGIWVMTHGWKIACDALDRKPIVRTQDVVQVGDVRRDGNYPEEVLFIADCECERPVFTRWKISQGTWCNDYHTLDSARKLTLLNPTDADGNPLEVNDGE